MHSQALTRAQVRNKISTRQMLLNGSSHDGCYAQSVARHCYHSAYNFSSSSGLLSIKAATSMTSQIEARLVADPRRLFAGYPPSAYWKKPFRRSPMDWLPLPLLLLLLEADPCFAAESPLPLLEAPGHRPVFHPGQRFCSTQASNNGTGVNNRSL